MTEIHQKRIQKRIEAINSVRDLYERMADEDVPAHDTRRVISKIKKAGRSIDNSSYSMYLVEGLSLIAAQCRTTGHHNLADEAEALVPQLSDL